MLQVNRSRKQSMSIAWLSVEKPVADRWNVHIGCPPAIVHRERLCFRPTFTRPRPGLLLWAYLV